MRALICLIVLPLCISLSGYAKNTPIRTSQFIKILTTKEQKARDRAIIAHLKGIFRTIPINELPSAKIEVRELLAEYKIEGTPALNEFIESECLQRKNDLDRAENALIRAIVLALKTDDHYLRYSLYSHLAFLQTFRGNTIEAVSNFRMAKKEAITANDADLQVVIDINISDIYYKNNFYSQSLFYLNHADSLVTTHQSSEPRLKNIVYFNKAEIYFRQGQLDSVKKYNAILNDKNIGSYKIYIYRQRTNYYLSLLNGDYKTALHNLTALQKDSLYKFDETDQQCLADAYARMGHADSARAVINRLLTAQKNHPEIAFKLYEMLAKIAEQEHQPNIAAANYKLSLAQLKDQSGRLTQVGTISSQMKIDEMQGDFIRKEEELKRERLYLVFAVVISVLAIVIAFISYRSIKQKRYYEKLLYTAQKEELSFINSHEIRRHLANILGIIDIIKNSDDKYADFQLTEDYLLHAAEQLDEAIKNISDKLDEEPAA